MKIKIIDIIFTVVEEFYRFALNTMAGFADLQLVRCDFLSLALPASCWH